MQVKITAYQIDSSSITSCRILKIRSGPDIQLTGYPIIVHGKIPEIRLYGQIVGYLAKYPHIWWNIRLSGLL